LASYGSAGFVNRETYNEADSAQAFPDIAALPNCDGGNLDLVVYPGVDHGFEVERVSTQTTA
jgi:hypothetical protein